MPRDEYEKCCSVAVLFSASAKLFAQRSKSVVCAPSASVIFIPEIFPSVSNMNVNFSPVNVFITAPSAVNIVVFSRISFAIFSKYVGTVSRHETKQSAESAPSPKHRSPSALFITYAAIWNRVSLPAKCSAICSAVSSVSVKYTAAAAISVREISVPIPGLNSSHSFRR